LTPDLSPDASVTEAVPSGWERLPTEAFGNHVGPFWRPPGEGDCLCGFIADGRHGNKRDVVHGGMVATAFDIGLGHACWSAADRNPIVTVSLLIQYVDALRMGEFATVQTEIVRTTRSMVFVRGVMKVADRTIATADGVWKRLAPRAAS
jgi:acyl-coenzyme A thioesterase PaaI-like protein